MYLTGTNSLVIHVCLAVIVHAELIKANLRLAGTSCAEIAKDLGVSRVTVSTVIHRRSTSARVEHAIAERLGLPVTKVFLVRGGARKSGRK